MSGREPWAWVRDRHEVEHELAGVLQRDDPLWPGQLATLIALALYLALPATLTVGPGWPLPAIEAALLAALVMASHGARRARRRRELTIGLVLVAVAAHLVALGLLSRYLVEGGRAEGAELVDGGLIIWVTNLLLFAVLYRELDRGGPQRPAGARAPVAPDLLFPQMTADRWATAGWKPRFGDCLYVSLTNQTAFSPTDTMPLLPRAKLLMGVQGLAALITTGVIVARAVDLLG